MQQTLIIFASTYCVVFALGLQSLCVNRGQYWLAFFNSFCISAAQLAILKLVPDASGWMQYSAYMVGGPLGIISSMRFHQHFFKHKTIKHKAVKCSVLRR